ncbi:glycosyltransferase [Thermodesulforhabdus norvegica]|uniref:Sugar transferase, PEP-CTERM/EpsH1 system associated n=1 Tax=Thermodesulforhabdus norvegica TaxID=39841 RepID=A0A1I4TVM7_9BACT|nr:glycosyltransferase [Thermodesulforhabdus norvegica]SFM80677.1 sugar transferase, PEP-CTERM/EpsH1 system associated [Thermodesulforhabdus norvegica]
MDILVLSPTLPWPLNMGSKIRIYYVLRELARAEHEVTLLSLAHEPYGETDLKALEPYCAELHVVPVEHRTRLRAALRAFFSTKPYRVAKFESPGFRRRVAETLRGKRWDVVWVHFLETLAYLPLEELKEKGFILVLDQHNADERFWATYAREGPPWVRLFALQNLWKLRQFQDEVLRWVDVVLSVSREDAEFTRLRLPNLSTEVWVVPNGVDTGSLRPSREEPRANRVIFCGAMDALMNEDAVEWFARRIFPKVREAVPDAEFWIVGRDPTPKVRALEALPGVRVTGRVEDVRPYYAKAKVAVAPFRYGGGTKLKVLEAMALGVPVVATPVGCQGIEAVPGKHLFVEEDGEKFAQRVVTLLQDEEFQKHMATQARQLVEQKYSWRSIMESAIVWLEQLVIA